MSNTETAREHATRITFWRALRSEALKLASVPGPRWGVLVTVVAWLVMAVVYGSLAPWIPTSEADRDVVTATSTQLARVATAGVLPAQLFALTMGVRVVAGEYADGSMQTTLLSLPKRGWVLTAKGLVVAALVAGVALVGGILSFAVAPALLLPRGYIVTSSTVVDVLGSVVAAALYLGLLAILSCAIAVLLRRTYTALLVGIVALFMLPPLTDLVVNAVPTFGWLTWGMPSTAGAILYSRETVGTESIAGLALPGGFAPAWTGAAILLAWGAALVTPALLVYARRDQSTVGTRAKAVRPSRRAGHARAPVPRARFTGALRSEWIKLRTLAAYRWILISFAAVIVGYGIFRAFLKPIQLGEDLDIDSRAETTYAITAGVGLGQLLIALVAVLLVTTEYSSGSIRVTFVAVPRRFAVLVAKLVVIAAVTAAVSLVALAVTAVVIIPIHESVGLRSVLDAGSTVPVLSGTLYLVLIAVLSAALAGVLRSITATMVVYSLLFLLLPHAFAMILAATRDTPEVWMGNLGQFLPSSGRFFYENVVLIGGMPNQFLADGTLILSPAQGLGVLTAWVILSVAAWWLTLMRRRV